MLGVSGPSSMLPGRKCWPRPPFQRLAWASRGPPSLTRLIANLFRMRARPTPSFHPAAIEGALPRLKPIRAEAEKCHPLLGFLCNPLLFSHHVAS